MREKAEVGFFEGSDIGLDGGVECVDEDLGRLFRFGEIFGYFEGMAGAWTGWFGG